MAGNLNEVGPKSNYLFHFWLQSKQYAADILRCLVISGCLIGCEQRHGILVLYLYLAYGYLCNYRTCSSCSGHQTVLLVNGQLIECINKQHFNIYYQYENIYKTFYILICVWQGKNVINNSFFGFWMNFCKVWVWWIFGSEIDHIWTKLVGQSLTHKRFQLIVLVRISHRSREFLVGHFFVVFDFSPQRGVLFSVFDHENALLLIVPSYHTWIIFWVSQEHHNPLGYFQWSSWNNKFSEKFFFL